MYGVIAARAMSIEQGWQLAEELLYRALKWELAGRRQRIAVYVHCCSPPGRRGLHVRREDGGAKLVRCSYGAIVDVIRTYGQHRPRTAIRRILPRPDGAVGRVLLLIHHETFSAARKHADAY
jgi:hypothetical protein